MAAAEAGKGSAQRPTNHQTFSANHDRIFGKGPRPEAIGMQGQGVSVVIMDEIGLTAANDPAVPTNDSEN